MAGKVSAIELQQKTEGMGILMEKIQGNSKKTGNDYHLARVAYIGTSITYFIQNVELFKQLQEGQIYMIKGTISERSDGNGLQLDNPKFEKIDAVL